MNRHGRPILLALLLAVVPPTAGRAQVLPPPKTGPQLASLINARASREIDLVADARAIPDDTSPDTLNRNWIALQNCVTAGRLAGKPITIRHHGGGIINVDRWTFVDSNDVAIVGDIGGRGGIKMKAGWGDPILLLGVPRDPVDLSVTPPAVVNLTTDHFPDAYGKLDSTAAAAPNTRFAWKSKADSHLADSFGLMSRAGVGGAHPEEADWSLTKLTVAFALDTTVDNHPSAVLIGMKRGKIPQPWCVTGNGQGGYQVKFVTQKANSPYAGTLRAFGFAAPTTPAVHRVVFHLDLDAATFKAALDNVQVAVTGDGSGQDENGNATGEPFVAGLRLQKNQACPFMVEALSGNSLNDWDETTPDGFSRTYLAFHVARADRYAWNGVGQAITRLGGAAINDNWQFLSRDADSLFCFDLTDTPTVMAATRSVRVLGGQAADFAGSHAFVVTKNAHADPYNARSTYRIADLSLKGGNPNYGQVVAMAQTLYPSFERCEIGDGAVAIGSLGSAANYIVKVRDCTLNGSECNVFNYYGIWDLRSIHSGQCGRALIRNNQGRLSVDQWFVEGNGQPETFLWSIGGGQNFLKKLDTDFENVPAVAPSICPYYAATGGSSAAILDIDAPTVGLLPAGVPHIWLDGPDTGARDGKFALRFRAGGCGDPLVKESGVRWAGRMGAEEVPAGVTAVQHVGGGSSGIAVMALP